MMERDSLLSDFGCVGEKKKRARRCTACLVATVVELILGGGLMTELPVLLASGVRKTSYLSCVEKCRFEKEVSQKLRHGFLSESIDWCKSESS